ncbi:hypothetical protein GP486_002449 [Trichoglossum hirsutum]|uniref:RRM domain-containing protein n=1 Tax=Trichoglossum hirsutum TaxID=265104 RepID=A0A9P8LEX5_9PEZI|nr:hypothetical protein GP486_002449 [Trichoglossum hirsutum]
MTDKLPPNLLALFAARPALRYLPPSDHAPEERRTANITGIAQYLDKLREPHEPEDYVPTESWLQRRDRLKLEKREKQQKLLTEGFAEYSPVKDPQIRGDAFKTLFVARLSFEVKESDLEREFGRFGPIERANSHADDPANSKKKKKPHRGYAFIVYEREKDMKAAYKETDGIRIKDRRVLVDVERGRTVKCWRPRRFGGGLGGRGYTKTAPPRPAGPGGFNAPAGPGGFRGGGFRGGYGGRGGFRGGGFGQPGFGSQGRGGIGYQGGGGGFGRSGYSGQPNGMGGGQPPPNAPSGPGGGRFGGDRGGFGSGGYGGTGSHDGDRGGHPPLNDSHAPSGPGAGTNGSGYGDPRSGRSYDDSRSSQRGGGRYGDSRGPGGGSGSNREPVRPRDGGGYRDRDRDGADDRGGYGSRYRDRDDDYPSRKRNFDGGAYEDHRSKRRY